uniref:Uncharacterized protein n=1 Tax=Parascaris univalens TaxID=6257 RepID=A0A914ZFP8_PARUN
SGSQCFVSGLLAMSAEAVVCNHIDPKNTAHRVRTSRNLRAERSFQTSSANSLKLVREHVGAKAEVDVMRSASILTKSATTNMKAKELKEVYFAAYNFSRSRIRLSEHILHR